MSINHDSTIDNMIARMSLSAYSKYDNEVSRCGHETAIARAIGDTLKEFIGILSVGTSVDRNIPEEYRKDPSWVSHMHKKTFMMFADELYKSGHYQIKETGFPFFEQVSYSLAILKLKK